MRAGRSHFGLCTFEWKLERNEQAQRHAHNSFLHDDGVHGTAVSIFETAHEEKQSCASAPPQYACAPRQRRRRFPSRAARRGAAQSPSRRFGFLADRSRQLRLRRRSRSPSLPARPITSSRLPSRSTPSLRVVALASPARSSSPTSASRAGAPPSPTIRSASAATTIPPRPPSRATRRSSASQALVSPWWFMWTETATRSSLPWLHVRVLALKADVQGVESTVQGPSSGRFRGHHRGKVRGTVH